MKKKKARETNGRNASGITPDELRAAAADQRDLAAELESGARWLEQCAGLSDEHSAGLDRELRRRVELSRKLRAVKLGLDGRQTERNAKLRYRLLTSCATIGRNLRGFDRYGHGPGDDIVTRSAEQEIAAIVSLDRALAPMLEPHVDKVAALIHAYRRNRGGRGKRAALSIEAAESQLLKALGWKVDRESAKRSARRLKKQGGL